MAQQEFSGNAVQATLSSSIAAGDSSMVLSSVSGWPTGASYPFVATIARGQADEEKVLIGSRTGTTLNISQRGYDGTTAVAHTAGTTVEHTISAVVIAEANAHVNDDTRDDHSQYLTTGRHDIPARHTFGAALGTPDAASDVGTVASAGNGDNPSRENHVHRLGAGSIDSASLFAANVVPAAAIPAATQTALRDAILPAGIILPYTAAAAPAGWLICDGAAVSRATYPSLFAAIGTTYGAGDGSTTFNLPNLKGRVPVGLDAGQTEFDALGETGGEKTHALTTAELATHSHGITDPGHKHNLTYNSNPSAFGGAFLAGSSAAGSTSVTGNPMDLAVTGITVNNAGSGTAHNNLQPFIALPYIVKAH